MPAGSKRSLKAAVTILLSTRRTHMPRGHKEYQGGRLPYGHFYLRLVRDVSEIAGVVVRACRHEAADYLRQGKATSCWRRHRDLAAYTAVPAIRNGYYPRVPRPSNLIETCWRWGIRRAILSRPGPFQGIQYRAIRQFDIDILRTKDSGKSGGFPEKLERRTSGTGLS
jgi:precorrin-6x reductase